MQSICFAFLNLDHLFADKQVADKCYQFTRLFANRLFPRSPMFRSGDYEDILAWADSTHSEYLMILGPGTILFNEQAVLSCVREVGEHEAMVLGDISIQSQTYPSLLHSAAFLDLGQWRRAKRPQWGKPGDTHAVKIPYQTQSSPDLLTSTGLTQDKLITGYGHNIIHKSLEHHKQVRALPAAFSKYTKVMQVIDYQEALAKCLFEDFIYHQDELDQESYQILAVMYDETLEGTVCQLTNDDHLIPFRVKTIHEARQDSNQPVIDNQGQLQIKEVVKPIVTNYQPEILDSTGQVMSRNTTSSPIVISSSVLAPGFHGSLYGSKKISGSSGSIQSSQVLSGSFRCRKLQVEISKLYSVPNGFRPLEILMEYGFTSDTEVIYFARNTTELAFRQVLLEDWDGENFPKFISDYADMYRFNQPRCDVPAAWQNTLETFGSAKEFKDLWQAYKKLRHHFTLVGRSKRFELAVEDGPGVYVYWDNLFTNTTTHYHESHVDIASDFAWFYKDLLEQNPNMLMEGTDHWGRPSCNHLKQRV